MPIRPICRSDRYADPQRRCQQLVCTTICPVDFGTNLAGNGPLSPPRQRPDPSLEHQSCGRGRAVTLLALARYQGRPATPHDTNAPVGSVTIEAQRSRRLPMAWFSPR